ncbi:MAG: hypothetical protein L0170_02935, partial [Acidobacteria bacterium]|nr:hypothetical protein [Acidobacteriota bacterium]
MALAEEVLRGDFLAISRAISQVENGASEAREVLDALASPRRDQTRRQFRGQDQSGAGIVHNLRACTFKRRAR